MSTPTVKCVIVGDGGAGKTCLLSTYTRGYFPTDYVPTVFDNYDKLVSLHGQQVQLSLWDTAGQEDYDKLRPLSYPQTDIFLVCFSVGNRPSFANVMEKWMPEVRQHMPRAPVILVGAKCDLREDREFLHHLQVHGARPVGRSEALEVARSIRAVKYIECSALRATNVSEVFEEAIRTVLWPEVTQNGRKHRRRSCTVQ